MVELPNLGSHTKIYNKHCATSAARARHVNHSCWRTVSFLPRQFLGGYGKRCGNQESKEAWTGEKGNWFVIFFDSDAWLQLCWVRISVLSTSCSVCFTAALKDRGNEAYAKEDYETAVKYYTDGLTELSDMQPLYTNRAQVNFLFFNIPWKKPPNKFPNSVVKALIIHIQVHVATVCL